MKNRMTFMNAIGILLENKKKTYPQHQLVRSLFSLALDDSESAEITDADNIKYSNWCKGIRPIPLDIIRTYETDDNFCFMEDDFRDKIIPNLINEIQARSQMEELVHDSRDVIGNQQADKLLAIHSPASFFTKVIRYAVLNEHNHSTLYSMDLAELLIGGRVPSHIKEFVGRKRELKDVHVLLEEHSPLFITGVAGIGKSEFAKVFAGKNKQKYTNIIYLYYSGDLKRSIAGLEFTGDNIEMTEAALFESHYSILKKLHSDSLMIIDNFNVLPKDDPFFRELIKNEFRIMFTTRCRITSFTTLELKELDRERELSELFYRHCPSAKNRADVISDIINILNGHTLTVCLAALALQASGMEAEELLLELKTSGLNADIGEEIEVYKDEEFSEARMMEHLRKLLQLNRLSELQTAVLRNLSLLADSGVGKAIFKRWMGLNNLNEVNTLIRYGYVYEDTENKKISLHPLIRDVAVLETMPSVNACLAMLDSLHLICLAHGREIRRPETVLFSLMSVNGRR